jgi:hypothetical protein
MLNAKKNSNSAEGADLNVEPLHFAHAPAFSRAFSSPREILSIIIIVVWEPCLRHAVLLHDASNWSS